MPVLSSFISYRPKRKTKPPIQVSSPFQVPAPNHGSPHPYASPRVLDINDGRLPAKSPNVLEQTSYYNPLNTPRVQLNMDPEPLTDWFPTNFLKSEPSSFMVDTKTNEASGSGTYYSGYGVNGSSERCNTTSVPEIKQQKSSDEGEVGDDGASSSAEDVLADLEAMDASDFVAQTGTDAELDPPQLTGKRPAPTPIKIPNAAFHGPKVQLIRSRPTSQISTPESSAVSGTTLARALMANTFVLSGESRQSRHRSGASTLTRTDSATLPRGEYSLINSPYWRDRTSFDFSLSPGSAPSEPVPPVPVNAEFVYVPPRTQRHTGDPRDKRSPDVERTEDASPSLNLEEPRSLRVTGVKPAQVNKAPEESVQEPSTNLNPSPPPTAPPDRGKSRRYSIRPGMDVAALINANDPSPPTSDSSPKDFDNVLDYYSFADTPDPIVQRPFRLPFSPITEESSSQLSPPTPFNRPDSRGSKRSLQPGRFFLGTTPSASSGGARVDWNIRGSARRDSSAKPLLPIGDRTAPAPTSTRSHASISSIPESVTSSITSSIASTNALQLPPKSVFNRLRSGSAPSPIKVVRDARDPHAYNITVTPHTSGSTGTGSSGGDGDSMIQQTFPETPSAFSPVFSPNGVASPGSSIVGDYLSMVAPQTPMSAFLPTSANIQPSLAQQVLLTRAATSVHGARHSRQASLTRLMRQQGLPVPRPASPLSPAMPSTPAPGSSNQTVASSSTNNLPEDPPMTQAPLDIKSTALKDLEEIGTRSEPHESRSLPGSERWLPISLPGSERAMLKSLPEDAIAPPPTPPRSPLIPPRSPLTSPSPSPPPPAPVLGTINLPELTPSPAAHTLSDLLTPTTDQPITPSSMSHYSEEAVLAYDRAPSGQNSVTSSRAPSRAASKRSNASIDSPKFGTKTLARGGPSRIPPPPSQVPPAPPPMPVGPPPINSVSHSVGGSVTSLPHHPSPTMHPVEPFGISSPVSAGSTSTVTASPFRRPGMINPPPPHMQLPPPQISASSLYDSSLSPPSYYAVINSDRSAGEAITPSTSGSYDPNYRFGQPYQPHSPPPNANGEFVPGSSNTLPPRGPQTQSVIMGGRRRTRPPLPAGPRRPQQHAPPVAPITGARERGGSVSSNSSQQPSLPNRPPRQPSAPLPSPRFATPSPKWRGYTMDAAKWTFTSTQLQAIVSRAIRQSSDPSSIRLLQLETLETEIPEEVQRLESLRTDTKMRYKTLARRRANMLDSLVGVVDAQDPDAALRQLEELKELCGTMDKTTEELHSVEEQLSQLAQLIQGHSASALAMALRKLNASFLKQFAEAQDLRQQVESLQAERDDAWNHAVEVANDYEDLRTGKIESPDTENRFVRVMAVRKLSTRAAKAGLRSAGVRSNHRASTGSSVRGLGVTTPSSARTTYADDLPPVPPIPRRRPVDIKTNIPIRSSTVTGVSTEFPTPSSDTRAMVRAQEELYDMLGIPIERFRRSRSVIGVPGESEALQQIASPSYANYDAPPNTGRRASLPPTTPLPPDPYSLAAANASIIWTSDRAGWF